MRRHDGLAGVISILLTAAILIGLASVLWEADFTEPENPIESTFPALVPEALEGTGNRTGADSGEAKEETPSPPEAEEPEPSPPSEAPQEPQVTPEIPENETPADGEDGPEETGDADQPKENPGGSADSGATGDGPAGDEGGEGGQGGSTPGDGGDDTPRIVTDLTDRIISRPELPDGILRFYAYPSVDDSACSIKAVMTNPATPANGTVLICTDGKNYEVPLVLNAVTTVTLFLKENGENLACVRYRIRYETEKAGEDNPQVGDFPPFITTNLDGFTGDMETQDFILRVSARTNPEGDAIYSNQIEVRLNGTPVSRRSGDIRPEYQLHFEPPNRGDRREYTVTVLAWDGRGNSSMAVYRLNYHTVSEGDDLGTVTVYLDATTVGLGIFDYSDEVPIVQGDTAADVIIRFLAEHDYTTLYGTELGGRSYLRRIDRPGICDGAQIPERLQTMLTRDNIPAGAHPGPDSLGEFDFSMGSGWMFTMNGSYPSSGLADNPLSDGDVLALHFTLSWGKDLGYSDVADGLSGYCGAWVDGVYTAYDHDFATTRVEPTETADGYVRSECRVCGDVTEEVLPMTGTGETPTPSPEPSPSPEPPPSPSPEPSPEAPPPPEPSPEPETPPDITENEETP